MSLSLDRAQIRKEPFDTEIVSLSSTATTTVNRSFKIAENTRRLEISVLPTITGGTPTTLLNTAIQNLSIRFNGNYFIDNLSGIEVEKMIENIYYKEAKEYTLEGLNTNLILAIPIPRDTQVDIQMTLGTIAQFVDGTPTTVSVQCRVHITDGNLTPLRGLMYRHLRKEPITGLTVGTEREIDLGTFKRLEKYIFIYVTNSGTPSDGFIKYVEILHNGNTVINRTAPEMKADYRHLSDDKAAGTGWYAINFPAGGFRADEASTLRLKIIPKATGANVIIRTFETYQTGINA